ncbi:hypothetical protein PHK61_13620 [Actinomycetospora lutea]|uniref:hypothetical protein n=1 Tax=Actinomycetospora lutea TaxID=663604 RepID=UPI002366675B|nr:hypothetical protein [Actinomycetospora lutea]MDD7939459.1 hypothetical protein [Actinomycetospora lutea]
MDWSHEQLTPEDARLFRRLAVFPGAFSLEQVEAVGVDGPTPSAAVTGAVAGVARLVEQSLVQAGDGRFWLLETLRTYAQERLAAAGEDRDIRGGTLTTRPLGSPRSPARCGPPPSRRPSRRRTS